MQLKKFYYHNLGYWFLLFIVLVIAGFYTTYFTRIFEPTPAIIHIHFVLMTLWLMMLIIQPFLIKFKKLSWHRGLGKASYVLVPMLLLTIFIVLRYEYSRNFAELNKEVTNGLKQISPAQILKQVTSTPIGFFYLIWFIVFYCLAIKNRRKSARHARYMLATSLTLIGPTVDRIVGIHFHLYEVFGLSSFVISFLIINTILALLLYLDYKNKKEPKTLLTCLAIYLIGQLCYFILPTFEWWSAFMKYIMLP